MEFAKPKLASRKLIIKKLKNKSKREFKKILIPKILAIMMVIALYLFVGEIFSKNFQWSSSFLAIVPGSIYLILTSIAWKRQRFGGGLFTILGIGLVLFNVWQGRDTLAIYILALITFILGFLFISFSEKRVKV